MRGETYVAEKPCRRGHLTRYVSSRSCVECVRLARKPLTPRQRERRSITACRARLVAALARLDARERAFLEAPAEPVRQSAKVFEGRPCRAGGHTLRYLSTGACVECLKQRAKGAS